MLMFSLGPTLQIVGIAALVLTAAVVALVWADGVPSRDVRTLFRRRPTEPTASPVPPDDWEAFEEYGRRMRADFDDLTAEQLQALYDTWRLWG